MALTPAPRLRLGELSVNFAGLLGQALGASGYAPQALLESFGLTPQRLAEPGARLSIPRYMRLGHAAIGLAGEPALGLRMGELCRLPVAGLAGVAAAQAPTLGEAARTLLRFEPLYASNYRGHSHLAEDAEGAWLWFYSIAPYNRFNRFVVDSLLSGWLHQLGALVGAPLVAEQLLIEFPAPGYAPAYAPLCQQPVRFEAPGNGVRLSKQQMALPNPAHCPGTWQQLLQLCETELEQLTRGRRLSERVVALLGPMLSGGREPDLESLAARLKMPSWTLRRKLAEEGVGFRELLNDTRRDLALAYIRDTELAFGEIAYLLGFASAEAFARAFKRWSGETPGCVRKARR